MFLGALLTLLGGAFKSQTNRWLIFAYIGQSLPAIAQPLIMNSPGKLASTWFREDKVI
jgi:hypothetical protein